MKFYCRKCGKPFSTDNLRDIFCPDCKAKNIYDPNEGLYADVREATYSGKSYGQWKGKGK